MAAQAEVAIPTSGRAAMGAGRRSPRRSRATSSEPGPPLVLLPALGGEAALLLPVARAEEALAVFLVGAQLERILAGVGPRRTAAARTPGERHGKQRRCEAGYSHSPSGI